MCNIELEEALDHVACVYSYPRDFGTHYAQSLLDANADGRITWSEFVGVPISEQIVISLKKITQIL